MLNHKLFDHTILKADATRSQIEQICREARDYGFASVCVNSYYTRFVRTLLDGSGVRTCTVVGFPLGQMSTKAKKLETACAVEDGAQEIDMVINVAALKDKEDSTVREEIRQIKEVCGENVLLKVILETCLLTEEEIIRACRLSKEAGADFVKTSTGFSTGGATVEDVALMYAQVGQSMGVKASGGIHSREQAEALVAAGATRLGTSATLQILK